MNNTEKEIGDIARFAATLPNVQCVNLLPYHSLGENKYNMIVQFESSTGAAYGNEEVAVDYVGAGVGELVLVASGSAVRTRDANHV